MYNELKDPANGYFSPTGVPCNANDVLNYYDGDGCNARIVYTPPDDRPLRILVNTAHKHETGAFVLRVTAGPTITNVKGQCLSEN